MAALTMALFPDGREPEKSLTQLNELIRELPRGREHSGRLTTIGLSTAFNPVHWTAAYPTYQDGRYVGVPVDSLLECIRKVDWIHPVLVVYRRGDEAKWSYAPFGGPELQDPLKSASSWLDGLGG